LRNFLQGFPGVVLPCLAVLAAACPRPPPRELSPAVAPPVLTRDPPAGPVKLALELYNGCSVLAGGVPVARGHAPIPYPERCDDMQQFAEARTVVPQAKMELLSGGEYALNELTLLDTLSSPTQPNSPQQVPEWFRTKSRFKDLDWRGVRPVTEDWIPDPDNQWVREVFFGEAQWMKGRDDQFLVEVLDSEGKVHQSMTYARGDFWAESPYFRNSRVSWLAYGVTPPEAPGPLPPLESAPGNFHAFVRLGLRGLLDPDRSFKLTGLHGDGALRVTWSLLPKQPFYFPVTYVEPAQRPATCYAGADDTRPVPCGFGLEPKLRLSPPKSGKGYYQPGEDLSLYFALEDRDGQRLHPRDELPSQNQFLAGHSNGLIYYTSGWWANHWGRDLFPSYKVLGPLQDLKGPSDVGTKAGYFQIPRQKGGRSSEGLLAQALAGDGVGGMREVRWSTRIPFTLAQDAKPGTYVALIRDARQSLGEWVSSGRALYFQVGQTEPTAYPGRVGGCEKCHVGTSALSQVGHGFAVQEIETCKGCHANYALNWARRVHELHGRSARYPLQKADCTACHTTRESALRASDEICSTCHPALHGDTYFQTRFTLKPKPGVPSRYDACAKACHEDTPPQGHVLPPPP